MKKLFAFLLTTLLLLSMAAVTVQADEAEPGYTLTLTQTNGQRGETIKIEYRLTGKKVKTLQIQPEIPDELEFVSDTWEISGGLSLTFQDTMSDPAVLSFNSPTDVDGVIYSVTYKIKNSDSVTDGKYPLGYTIFTVVTKVGDAPEAPVYNYDASDPSREPEVQGADSIAITLGEVYVHQHDETCIVWVEKVDPTCMEGTEAHWECNKLHQAYAGTEGNLTVPLTPLDASTLRIAPLQAHVFTKNDGTESSVKVSTRTCTEDGVKKAYFVCVNCKNKFDYEDKTLIDDLTFLNDYVDKALGHQLSKVDEKPATCKADGTEAYWKCGNCSKLFSDEEGKTAISAPVVIPKGAHVVAEADWTITKEAKCEEAGEKKGTCTICSEEVTDVIAALGHDWGEWDETDTATCTEAGKQIHVCSRCSEEEEQDIPALGHDYGEWIEITPATCTEAGEKTHTCSRDASHVETLPIPALGHDFENGTVTYDPEPTCTEAGKKITKCARCDAIEEKEVPALGHAWGPWRVTKEATTTEEGIEERTCSRCDAFQKRTIPKLSDSLPDGFEKAMAYYRNQQRQLAAERAAKKAAEEAAAKKAAEEAAKAAEEAAKAAEEAGKDGFGPEIPAIDDTWINPFIDVFETDSYYDAVRYVNEAGLFNGMTPTEFGPAVTMNRAMFVTVLGRLAGVDPDAYPTTSFIDVQPLGTWNYAPYVEWAAQNEIVLGYGDGRFGPEDMVTVEQAAVILARYAKYIGMDTTPEALLSTFADGAAVSAWAAEALAWTADTGVYIGTNGALNPQSFAARSLIATMLYNFANIGEK